MTDPDDPAFAKTVSIGFGDVTIAQGLTKRELFAAMAMQGILMGLQLDRIVQRENIVRMSIEVADALCTELSKEVTK